MKFCSLKAPYSLRGWVGMPFALRNKDEVQPLERTPFNALVFCDGQRDLDNITISESMQHALLSFEKEGVVAFHEEPRALQPEQYYRYYDTRYFKSVMWSITGKCNFKCRHCYLDAPDAAFGEINTEEAFSIIDQMAECGICRVNLTGGEPLVRKDFWQLIDRLGQRDISIRQVYTNGWLLTEGMLDRFTGRGIKPEFCISFDGSGWHDWMRGVAGAEKSALRALNLCREKGFSTSVEMCIHKGNKDTLRESILRLAETGTRSIKVSDVINTDLWIKKSEGNE